MQSPQPGQVIYIGAELALSNALLAEVAGRKTLDMGVYRNRAGKSDSWVQVKTSNGSYVKYGSLPAVTVAKLKVEFGDVETIGLMAIFQRLIDMAVEPIDGDYLRESMCFTPDQIVQLCEACAWLRVVAQEGGIDHFTNRTGYLEAVVKCLRLRKLYGFKITSLVSLRRRLRAWQDKGHASMVSAKFGNGNSLKHDEDERAAIVDRIIDLYSDPTKPSIETVHRIVNTELVNGEFGDSLEPLSYERIRQIVQKPRHKHMWVHSRHGEEEGRQMTEAVIKRRRPRISDTVWSVDGTAVQLLAKDGRKLYTPWYVVQVVDAATDLIVGFALGNTETAALVLRALRNAVRRRNTAPVIAHYDGASANKGSEVKQALAAIKATGIKAQPYNGKAKHVERVIGMFEQQMLRTAPNFKGGNVTTRSKNSQANPELIKKLMSDDVQLSADTVAEQYAAYVELWNNTVPKGKKVSRLEAYLSTETAGRILDDKAVSNAFWIERKHRASYDPRGLEIQVEGVRLAYEVESSRGVESEEFREAFLGLAMTVRYDPDDASAVGLYREGKWAGLAALKYEYSANPLDHSADDRRALLSRQVARKNYILRGISDAQKARERSRGLDLPVLNPQLTHKDAFNDASEAAQDVLLGLAEQVEAATPNARKGAASAKTGRKPQVLAKAAHETAPEEQLEEVIDYGSPFRAPADVLERMLNKVKMDNE